MNTAPLKSYAPAARRAFIAAVTAQAARLGITAKEIAPATVQGDVLLVNGQPFPRSAESGRMSLIRRVKSQGFEATMDAVAYTWFNRLVAIRYMELHNYLDHGYRVLSDPGGSGRPEILDKAAEVELSGLDRAKVVQLKLDGTRDEELYRMLLIAQCNALHKAMPFLFEKIGHETELLLPANLLHTDSLLRQLVDSIEESAWQQIEIIGWLYQFYISEKKDQVIGKVVKSEDIPAATQLFTPNWIVKYMVQNTLGAQWLATYPGSPLRAQMEYYIEPAEQIEEVKAQLAAITPASLNPEEITLIDPACGSGHILVEAYDLFKAIYVERGYRERDAAQLILTKNLYGLDIDPRAAQLSGFALMMKGRADDRRLFERGLQLNVMAMINSDSFQISDLTDQSRLRNSDVELSCLSDVKALFSHATTFGSLIHLPESLAKKVAPLRKWVGEMLEQELGPTHDLFSAEALKCLDHLTKQAEMLLSQYDHVLANPPFMGSKYLVSILKKKLKDDYSGFSKDLFSAFIIRSIALAKTGGRIGLMSPFVWMFISSHERLRNQLILQETISSLIQLEYSGFEGATVPVCTFTLRKGRREGEKGCYIRLTDFKGSINQGPKTLEAISDRSCGWFFEINQGEFTKIPGSPLAFWVSDKVRSVYRNSSLLGDHMPVRMGMATTDNKRFLRSWFEVDFASIGFGMASRECAAISGRTWFPYNKGGKYRRWYGNMDFVVNYYNDGAELKEVVKAKYREAEYAEGFTDERWDKLIEVWVLKNQQFYFLPAISWSFVSSSFFGVRWYPQGFIFDVSGSCAFPRKEDFFPLLGLLSSSVAALLMKIQNPTLNFQVENVIAIPVRHGIINLELEHLIQQLLELTQDDWNQYERSWEFARFPLLSAAADGDVSLQVSYSRWISDNLEKTSKMKRLEEENNRIFIDAYELSKELAPNVDSDHITITVNPVYRYGSELPEEERSVRFREDTMQELISYAIGCMMGRYSMDEPGLIYAHSGNVGFDSSRYTKFPADGDGIIPVTDSAWFEDDAATRLEEFLSVAWDKAHLEENLTFLAENLSPNKNETSRDTIRRYLCDKFFKNHLQTYKKRPIYWLFSSGKQKAFQCLVYLHRYNEGTLARMRSEYVIPLQGKMAARLAHLAEDRVSASAAQEKRIDKEATKLKKQHAELLEFDEKLRHYADRRISLDLDDGVKVNYGKFGSLLAEVTTVHGQKAEGP